MLSLIVALIVTALAVYVSLNMKETKEMFAKVVPEPFRKPFGIVLFLAFILLVGISLYIIIQESEGHDESYPKAIEQGKKAFEMEADETADVIEGYLASLKPGSGKRTSFSNLKKAYLLKKNPAAMGVNPSIMDNKCHTYIVDREDDCMMRC